MEKATFKLTVGEFCRTLEACNAEERSLSNEVLETFGTFIEEILLALYTTVGSSDTINVKDVFQDRSDLIFPIQHPEQHEKVISYLKGLQEANEDCLCRIYGTIIMCRNNLKVAEEQMLGKKMKKEEMTDLLNFLTVTTNIIQSNVINTSLKRWEGKIKVYQEPFSYHNKEVDVEEISKRNLGRMIVHYIHYINNEGVQEKPSLPRLLQACIGFLPTKPGGLWKNASITIYDVDRNMYKIASGTGKHQFICWMENGEPFIKEKTLDLEHKKPKSNHMPSTETTHNSSQKMENFEQTVNNFCCFLEVCSAEQQLVAIKVWKSFITFVEEILLAHHLKIGSSDAINVKQLLYQDLVDLIWHLQPEQHEHVISYLTRLQEAKEDRLNSLLRNVTMCKDNLQVLMKEVLQKKMKEQEKLDIMDSMIMTKNIIQGLKGKTNDSYLTNLLEQMEEHRGTFSFEDEEIDVKEINKRNLGKMIVSYVGHEGVEEKQGLRRLLQACIDFLQKEAAEVWKNASITIYDEDDNMYTIASGTRKHQFICCIQNGEPCINEITPVSEHKKPKQNHKPSKETSHHPSQKQQCHECSIS